MISSRSALITEAVKPMSSPVLTPLDPGFIASDFRYGVRSTREKWTQRTSASATAAASPARTTNICGANRPGRAQPAEARSEGNTARAITYTKNGPNWAKTSGMTGLNQITSTLRLSNTARFKAGRNRRGGASRPIRGEKPCALQWLPCSDPKNGKVFLPLYQLALAERALDFGGDSTSGSAN